MRAGNKRYFGNEYPKLPEREEEADRGPPAEVARQGKHKVGAFSRGEARGGVGRNWRWGG